MMRGRVRFKLAVKLRKVNCFSSNKSCTYSTKISRSPKPVLVRLWWYSVTTAFVCKALDSWNDVVIFSLEDIRL